MSTPPITWRETRRRLVEDEARIRTMLRERFDLEPRWLLFDASWRCVLLHRMAHYFWRRDARKSARVLMQLNSLVTGADIHPNCDFGGGFLIPHPAALTASGNAGRNFTMMPLAGIGILPRAEDVGAGPGLPLLGDDVWVGASCGVLGPLRVGSGSRLQPGSPVTRDVPPGSLVEAAARPVRVDRALAPVDSGARPRQPDRRPCRHGSWGSTWQDFDRDILRYLAMRDPSARSVPGPLRKLSATLTTEVMGVALHRVSHFLHCAGWRRLARLWCHANILLFRLTITPSSCLGGGVFLPHPAGMVINATAGAALTMFARSFCTSLGPALAADVNEGPVIGDRVVIAGMAAAIGPIVLGNDVRIAPNTHALADVPDGHLVAGTMMVTHVEPLAAPVMAEVEGLEPRLVSRPVVARIAYAETRRLLREDRERLRALHRGAAPWASRACVFLFRHARFFLGAGHARLARWCWRLNVRLTGADIDARSDIGGGLVIPNPAGIAVHATAGRNLTVRALAGIGAEVATRPFANAAHDRPVLGDDVDLAEHAALHGAIRVGARARIGFGCRIRKDVGDGAALEMPAARARRMPPASVGEST